MVEIIGIGIVVMLLGACDEKKQKDASQQSNLSTAKSEDKVAGHFLCKDKPTSRYCENANGTITDTRSSLIWLKDGSCDDLGTNGNGADTFTNANLAASQLAEGKCGLMDGSKPGDWRLPSKEEWEAMIDKSYTAPSLSNAAGNGQWEEGNLFIAVKSEGYWTSTPEKNDAGFAWGVGLFGGVIVSANKNIEGNIWPVREP